MRKNLIHVLLDNILNPLWLKQDHSTTSQRIVEKITNMIISYVPQSIRKYVFYFIDTLAIVITRYFTLLYQLHLSIYIIEGTGKFNGQEIKSILITSKNSLPYIIDLIYISNAKITFLEKVFLWNIPKIKKKFANQVDMMFIICDKFYQRFFHQNEFLILPQYVTFKLDISEDLSTLYKRFSKSAKEDIRKAKRMGYTYEVSRDQKKLRIFYDEMYKPYTYTRYGKQAVCANFSAIRHLFERGGKLMLIANKNKYIFGSLFYTKNKTIIGTHAGIIDGNVDRLKEGIGGASYYFAILWAKEQGAEFLDFGTCKPFLNDGLFKYKKKWGAFVEKSESSYEVICFKVCADNKGIKNFFLNNPLIFLSNNELNIKVYLPREKKSKNLDTELEQYKIAGINDISYEFLNNTSY